MTADRKIARLQNLREQRQRLSQLKVYTSLAEANHAQRGVVEAEDRLSFVQNEARDVVKRSLKSAEEVRDPSARFTGIVLTLARNHEWIEEETDKLRQWQDIHDEKVKIANGAKANFIESNRAAEKFQRLSKQLKLDAQRLLEEREYDQSHDVSSFGREQS